MAAGRPQPTCVAAVHLRRTSSPTVASRGRVSGRLVTGSADMRGCGPLPRDLESTVASHGRVSGRLATVLAAGLATAHDRDVATPGQARLRRPVEACSAFRREKVDTRTSARPPGGSDGTQLSRCQARAGRLHWIAVPPPAVAVTLASPSR